MKRLLNIWDPFKTGYKRAVLIISYLPFLAISIIVSLSAYARISEKDFPFEVLIIVSTGLAFFLVIGILILRKREYFASILLVTGVGTLGIFSIYLWGLIHPIGFLLCLLSLRLAYILLLDRLARIINFLLFLLILLIGSLHLFEVVAYDYSWSPKLTIFDFSIVLFLILLFSVIAVINSIGIRKHEARIKRMKDRLYDANLSLQREIVLKTKEVISSKTRLTRSIRTLKSAYGLLEDSEIDRFSKINMLGHYGLIMSSVIHSMANPLMLVMSKLNKANFPEKKTVMKAINELSDSVRSVRDNVRIDSGDKEISVKEILTEVLEVLQWRFKKENIPIIKKFVSSDILVKSGASQFRDILLNLLNNAIEASVLSRQKEIRVKYLKTNKVGIIRIENLGPQIAKNIQNKIFEIFYSSKINNSGVGLYLSRKYAREFFNGDVKLLKSDKNKTIFEFWFKY